MESPDAILRWALRDLPRPDARLCLSVERFCAHELGIGRGAALLLAISGGADSVAQAVIFSILAPRHDWRLGAMHINHNLRDAAEQDAAFSRELCGRLGIDCAVARLDTRQFADHLGCGIEEAGRTGRYNLLEKKRKAGDFDWILVAHHAGDLAEDIMMRLLRGAGWPALGGMREKDARRRLLRPLFYLHPQRLRLFLRNLKIPWREDESNASMDFLRNRIRTGTLPRLRAENAALERTLGNLHKLAAIDETYWEDILDAALLESPWSLENRGESTRLVLPRPLLSSLGKAARLRLYCRALAKMRSLLQAPGQPRMETLLKLDAGWLAARGGLRFQLPGRIEALVAKGEIIFRSCLHTASDAGFPIRRATKSGGNEPKTAFFGE